MTTAKAAEIMFGEKLYQIRARKVLPILVRQVEAQQTITYEDLFLVVLEKHYCIYQGNGTKKSH